MNMRFGTWDVRSQLAECNLDVVAVQEVRWVRMTIGFFIHKRIISAVKRVEFAIVCCNTKRSLETA
jgi:hypothetical protein